MSTDIDQTLEHSIVFGGPFIVASNTFGHQLSRRVSFSTLNVFHCIYNFPIDFMFSERMGLNK